MSRKQQKGLQLRRPDDLAKPVGGLSVILVGAVVFALMHLTGVEKPWAPALVGAAVYSLALVYGKRKWFHSGILALLVLSLLILRTRIQDGFCQWYNGIGAIYTAENGIVLPPLIESGDSWNIPIFSCWISAAMGMGFVFLWQWGPEAVSAVVLLFYGGISLALGRMVDPLPLLLAELMLCTGRGLKNYALPVGILTAAALFSLIPGVAGLAGAQSEAVLQQLHHYKYETSCTTLPEGRLEQLKQSDAPALIVTMETPEVLYLRGFTGARIEDDRWLPLDCEILAENRYLLYWLNSREFDLRAQFESASTFLETMKNTVSVQNVGACSAYRYIPFTICADDRLDPENLTDTAEGERYDSFTTVYGGAEILTELLSVLESDDRRYLQAEAAYREFVEAHYRSIPEEMSEKLRPYWDKTEGMDAQSAVKAVLENCYPEGIQNDPFYATTAVLTLRHFGIPARYAEGYILPQTTSTTVELTGRHAACWAEVYHDGIGWLPMALTPGLDGETEQQEEQPQPPDTPEETLPPETEPVTEPEPNGGHQVRIAKVLLSSAVIVILLLMLLAAGLILRRRYILKKRQVILEQEDIREAVAWSFSSSIAMLERMGIHRGNGSLAALSAPIRERFGEAAAVQFDEASSLNSKALFSSHVMSEEERQSVHRFRLTALELLRQNSNRLQRFWMQYILCLF